MRKNTKVEAPPKYFNLSNLLKFLEAYQPDGNYPYDSTHACMIAHFAAAYSRNHSEPIFHGMPAEVIKDGQVAVASISSGKWFKVPDVFVAIAKAEPHTYPAALERARRAYAEQNRAFEATKAA